MENFYPRPGDDPQDVQPTQQFWPAPDAAAGYQSPGGPGGAGFGTPGGPGFGAPGGPGDARFGGPGFGSPGGPGFGGTGGPGFGAPGGPGDPGGPGGPGQHWQQPSGLPAHLAKDRHRARRWAIGVVTAAVLAAGGVTAGVALAGHSSGSGRAGQAAALNAVLSSSNSAAANPGTGTSQTPGTARPCAHAAKAARASGRPRLARALAFGCRRLLVRALLHGVHGQFTFSTKNGPRTLAFERGTISSVAAGQDIVVHASDGTTWTWDIVSNTVVRVRGGKVTPSALSTGETVWVGGPVAAGTKDARLIVILPAGGASSAPSSTPAG